MPLRIRGDSLLHQERPGGETSDIDLNSVLGQHNGVFILGGSNFAGSKLMQIQLDGKMLRATFQVPKHGLRDASIDLEACGIVRNYGLVCPPALTDEALNIKATTSINRALRTARSTRTTFSANLKHPSHAPWLRCQEAEAQCLFHLAALERLLLGKGSRAFPAFPRLLPGLLAHDKRKYAASPCTDSRTGFVGNYGRFIRGAPSCRPRDWASVFETAREIITELIGQIRSTRCGLSPQIVEHLRAAERALSMSCHLRRYHYDGLDPRIARRRSRFSKRLQVVADDFVRLLQPAIEIDIEVYGPEMCDVDEKDDPFLG